MTFKMRLYVSGRDESSRRAIKNLRALCEDELDGEFEVEVIDVLENPTFAEHEKIIATPTLVRLRPLPPKKILGDLSDRSKVLLGLDMLSPLQANGPR